MEILCRSYASSFFAESGIHFATVRAGNVIGGGDFSEGRLALDLSEFAGSQRHNYSSAVQSVLGRMSWTVFLVISLISKGLEAASEFSGAWNFGQTKVRAERLGVARKISEAGAKRLEQTISESTFHEARFSV